MMFGAQRQYFTDDQRSEVPTVDQERKAYIVRDVHKDISEKLVEELIKFPNNHASIRLEISDTMDDEYEMMERHFEHRPQEYRIDVEVTEVIYQVSTPISYRFEKVIRFENLSKFQKILIRLFQIKTETL